MSQFNIPYINEEFYAPHVAPEDLDALLSDGWRHFGELFFRYSFGVCDGQIRTVIPLRIRLKNFAFSKSQRRVLKKNRDLRIVIRPAEIDEEKEKLFDRHKVRFREGSPSSLYDFLSFAPARVPCEAREISVYQDERLLAASFFDVGTESVSGIYAIHEPTEAARGLGIYTMLREITFALETGRKFYYQGYAYDGNSFYDYKKRFRALEKYGWNEEWTTFDDSPNA